MAVYVLIYNAGSDNEGIHSLKVQGEDTILMFEDEDDALRFATLLEAQDFPVPTVEPIDPEEVQWFCQEHGFHCQRVPRGALVIPPPTNLDKTDWQPERTPSEELDEIRRRLERLL